MNKKQLANLGIDKETSNIAVDCIKKAAESGYWRGRTVRRVITDILYEPSKFLGDANFGDFASALMQHKVKQPYAPPEPIAFSIWGRQHIDENAIEQMKTAMQLPIAVAGAVMPDAHLGYGLPIGGVLATEDAVIPYAVGVDIACRMRISITDIPVARLVNNQMKMSTALSEGTMFGVGSTWNPPFQHRVMDQKWDITPVTKLLKDKAWKQLGTSGSGNHFVEWGILTLEKPLPFAPELSLGQYVALMSHSGSRGAGAQVCQYYHGIAVQKLEDKYKDYFKNLAWLMMGSEAGQEYWRAMNLMGEYASANHECIHHNVIEQSMHAEIVASVENHHNFAWIENHMGRDVIVHRKGATPAGRGVLGVIPGSMADSCYIVRGLGSPESLHSSSHGAGRIMSRKQAMREMNPDHWKGVLRQKGIKLISAGMDEMPGVYKPIAQVMAAQSDLVETIGEFQPKIVKMADDGRSED